MRGLCSIYLYQEKKIEHRLFWILVTFILLRWIHLPRSLRKSESLLPWKEKKVGVALFDQVIDCLKIKTLLLRLLPVVVVMMRTLLRNYFRKFTPGTRNLKNFKVVLPWITFGKLCLSKRERLWLAGCIFVFTKE